MSKTTIQQPARKGFRYWLPRVGFTVIAIFIASMAIIGIVKAEEMSHWVKTDNEIAVILDKDSGEIIDIFQNFGNAFELNDDEELVYTTSPEWRSYTDADPNDDFFDFRSTYTPVLTEISSDAVVNGESQTVWFNTKVSLGDADMIKEYYNGLISDGQMYDLGPALSPFTVVYDDIYSKLSDSKTSELLPALQIAPTEPRIKTDSVVAAVYASGMSATDALNGLDVPGEELRPRYAKTVAEYDFGCERTGLYVVNKDEYLATLGEIVGVDPSFLRGNLNYNEVQSTTAEPCSIDVSFLISSSDLEMSDNHLNMTTIDGPEIAYDAETSTFN